VVTILQDSSKSLANSEYKTNPEKFKQHAKEIDAIVSKLRQIDNEIGNLNAPKDLQLKRDEYRKAYEKAISSVSGMSDFLVSIANLSESNHGNIPVSDMEKLVRRASNLSADMNSAKETMNKIASDMKDIRDSKK
jgi:hypothetical protein